MAAYYLDRHDVFGCEGVDDLPGGDVPVGEGVGQCFGVRAVENSEHGGHGARGAVDLRLCGCHPVRESTQGTPSQLGEQNHPTVGRTGRTSVEAGLYRIHAPVAAVEAGLDPIYRRLHPVSDVTQR